MKYWLVKQEPQSYSIDDLARDVRTCWDGVRNYQARNMLRDDFAKGDLVMFYHSNCDAPAIVGIAEVVRTGYPDPTQFDPKDAHFDPGSRPDTPRWVAVDIRFKRRLRRPILLQDMKQEPLLDGLQLLQRGNRLSVMPVAKKHWDHILKLEKQG